MSNQPDPPPAFSVALLIETSSTYGRQILRGIHRYVQTDQSQDWTAVLEERDLNSSPPHWLENWSGVGIISRQTFVDPPAGFHSEIAFVELNDRHESKRFTTVRSDDFQIGRLAAEHLWERGLTHFAFCGFENESWSERRQSGFESHVRGTAKASFDSLQSDWYARDVKQWEQEKIRLTEWLRQLPKPVGIMACNDIRGKQLIDCCHEAGIRIPESVAIVGVDNDELLCSFSRTPMTSVIPNAEGIGFRAAQILAGMMTDIQLRSRVEEILVPPLGVFSRRSSDIVAVDDRELATALRFIRNRACEGISVADVIEASGMSRSTLERKMRGMINRSPQQEIRRVQLRQVCTLLAGTELSIESIALQCGFEHPEYLHVVFKREHQITPGEYRIRAGG